MDRRDTFYTARLPPSTVASRRASIDSVSSAADRRRWRNHDHVLTPEPQAVERDPFDVFMGGAEIVKRCGGVDEKSRIKKESGEEEIEEEVEHVEPEEEIEDTESRISTQNPIDTTPPNGNRNGSKYTPDSEQSDSKPESASLRRHTKLPWRERIRHFTWTWFCLTMATGGIANVLYAVPFRFRGLYTLGCIFFIANIFLFLCNVALISTRFYCYPRTFRASFLHPTESLFIPAAIVSFGIIMMNVSQYGVGMVGEGRWLQHVMIVLFWVDCGLAVTFSLGIYLIMCVGFLPYMSFVLRLMHVRWSTTTFTINQMTPIWIFPGMSFSCGYSSLLTYIQPTRFSSSVRMLVVSRLKSPIQIPPSVSSSAATSSRASASSSV